MIMAQHYWVKKFRLKEAVVPWHQQQWVGKLCWQRTEAVACCSLEREKLAEVEEQESSQKLSSIFHVWLLKNKQMVTDWWLVVDINSICLIHMICSISRVSVFFQLHFCVNLKLLFLWYVRVNKRQFYERGTESTISALTLKLSLACMQGLCSCTLTSFKNQSKHSFFLCRTFSVPTCSHLIKGLNVLSVVPIKHTQVNVFTRYKPLHPEGMKATVFCFW